MSLCMSSLRDPRHLRVQSETVGYAHPLPLPGMPHRTPRSLKHEYELFVEEEIENYKDSIPRSALLKIGDEAVGSLASEAQFALTELLLCEEVDRIIRSRLRLPTYRTWRARRIKLLERYRTPEHWGLPADSPVVRDVQPAAEGHVLIAGEASEGAALYLAAHGSDVTRLDQEPAAVERVIAAAQAAGLVGRVRGYASDLGHWSPDVPLSAVICSSSAFTPMSASERWRVIDTLKDATRRGGVHLVESIAGRDSEMTVADLRARYRGWEISVREQAPSSEAFLARKAVA